MSDGSGFSSLPPAVKGGPQIGKLLAPQPARVVQLPDALQTVARAQRIEGEVVQQNRDGSVRMRTPQGEIDIQVRGRNTPSQGQKIEIDIPAGRPPRQVIVRPAPQTTPQTAPQPDTPQIQTPQTRPQAQTGQTSAPPPSSRPLPAQPQPLPATPQTVQSTPAPLENGTVVRLLPVSTAQAQQIVQQSLAQIETLPAQIQRIVFAANLTAQSAVQNQTAELLQVRPQTLQTPAQQTIQNVLQQPQTQFFTPNAQQTPIQQFLSSPAQPVSQSQGQIQITQLPGLQNVSGAIQTPVQSVPQAPILVQPSADGFLTQPLNSLNNARITQLDAQILQTRPPGITLVQPQTSGTPQIQIQTQIQAQIQTQPQFLLPGQSQSAFQTGPLTLNAQVTGFTPQNLPLISLQLPGTTLPQNFVLQFQASNLQVGSQIQISPQNVIATPSPSAQLPQNFNFTNFLRGWSWPVLDDAYQALSQISPQAAQSLSRALPSPANPSQMGPAAMLFIAAIRSGDLASWLGDRRIDLLQRAGRGNIAGNLLQEAGNISRAGAEALSGEWRAVPLPMYWDNEIHKITLYTRKDDQSGQSDDPDKKGQTRFIFDLNLSRMGEVQLDGLLRDDRLDLVVRTGHPFSVSMQQTMKQAYTQALEETSLHGELSFQGDLKNWVNVLQQEKAFGADI